MLRPWRLLLPLLTGLLLPGRALAEAPQGPSRCEGAPEGAGEGVYRPTTSGPFVALTAPLTACGRLLLQPILSVARTRGTYDARARHVPLAPGASQLATSMSLFLEYGVLERVAAGAQLTVLHQRRRAGGREAHATGPGDTLLFGRLGLLHETAGGLPEATLLAQVKLPTGRVKSAASTLLDTDVRGTGSADLTVGLDFSKGARPVLLHLDLLYTHALPAHVGEVATAYGDTFSWSFSGEWPFLPERFALMLEASGRHQGAPRREGVEAADGALGELVLGTGVEVLFGPDLQLLVGYQRTLWGRNVPAVDSFVATLVPTLF
ncbi:hypothetical protein KH5H1_67810 [Corallococcus caeni]|uniref:Transporter n=1 Tax=Corallococcus caeni TaxID=3082388 RepID=A0ABQ6R387_9BACT|nr:hypothetical protein KH5H1_67810 [Corallococcus sp. KH5-1]GMU10789.1 hypothetical protein ASNO1_70430 [Corallococcus sp. NO1]